MKQHLVFPEVPPDVHTCSTGSTTFNNAAKNIREAMIALKPAIEEILSRRGGQLIYDGSEYGVPEKPLRVAGLYCG